MVKFLFEFIILKCLWQKRTHFRENFLRNKNFRQTKFRENLLIFAFRENGKNFFVSTLHVF
jgi:hypothetical protein